MTSPFSPQLNTEPINNYSDIEPISAAFPRPSSPSIEASAKHFQELMGQAPPDSPPMPQGATTNPDQTQEQKQLAAAIASYIVAAAKNDSFNFNYFMSQIYDDYKSQDH